MRFAAFGLLAAALAVQPQIASAKLSFEKRAIIVRGLMAEYGTAKLVIPRSKKALSLFPEGRLDQEQWEAAMNKFGPAARLGDLVQITKIEFKKNKLVLQLNHGLKGGRKWWHRIQVSGTGRRGGTLGDSRSVHAPGGTLLALVFEDGGDIPDMTPDEFKAMLKPILDFEQRSATELYMDSIPEEFKEAIEEKRASVGMDRDMVLLAKGMADRKVRDFKDGIEREDWIYGTPPGTIIFVTFEDGKVIRVRESYANPGGQVKTEDEPRDKK